MRSPIALLAALALAVVAACGRDARVAGPPATDVEPSSPAMSARPITAPIASESASASSSAAATTSGAAPPAAPAPIDGQLPSPDAFALSTKAGCPTKTCRLEGSLLEALLGAPESHSPAGIWEEDLGAGAAVTFARRADMDVLGIALSGPLTLTGDEPKGKTVELLPWHAFVAPGGGITLRTKGAPARVVLVVVTAGEPLAAKVAAAKVNPWTSRPAAMATVDLAAATDLAWGKGAYHARIGLTADTSPHASLGILKMSADGVVAPHVHEKEWEHMAILQGEGDFLQGVGENEHALHASDGVIFSVPPGTRHQWRPAGSRPFLGIQVYTPPGPEQRFKRLAAPP